MANTFPGHKNCTYLRVCRWLHFSRIGKRLLTSVFNLIQNHSITCKISLVHCIFITFSSKRVTTSLLRFTRHTEFYWSLCVVSKLANYDWLSVTYNGMSDIESMLAGILGYAFMLPGNTFFSRKWSISGLLLMLNYDCFQNFDVITKLPGDESQYTSFSYLRVCSNKFQYYQS